MKGVVALFNMENQLIGILHIFKMAFIFVGMLVLTVIENKVNFTISVLYIASTSFFIENGIQKKYLKSKAQIMGSKSVAKLKRTDSGFNNIIDGYGVFKLNYEFQVTNNVTLQMQADKLITNLIYAFGLRIICLLWMKQNLGVELFLSGLRVLMVHTVDNIKREYWIAEASFILIVTGFELAPNLEEYGVVKGPNSMIHQVPLLTIYLFGMCVILMLAGKNLTISSLMMKLKIKDEIIERLVKNNDNQPVVLLKLNEPNLNKIDFKELSSSPSTDASKNENHGSAPFVSIENYLGKKSGISPSKILYDVSCMNQLAKNSMQNIMMGPDIKPELKKKLNILDVQHKFRSIQIPKKQNDNNQEKNLHKILNQSSALLFKDILLEKLNKKNSVHFQSFEDQFSKKEKRDQQNLNGVQMSQSDNSSNENIQSYELDNFTEQGEEMGYKGFSKIKYQKFKKLSNNTMVLFDDYFRIDKNLVQQIQCIIVYDTFILQFFEPFTVSNDITGAPKQNQEYQMDLLNEERPTQSLYVMDKLEVQSDFNKNRSKHILQRQNSGRLNPLKPRGDQKEIQRHGTIMHQQSIKQDKKLLNLKKVGFLEFEEGSLRSKDMFQGSQSSTVKININQSEGSPRSFYSEVNKTSKLNIRDKPYHNGNIHQRIEASELKNEQKEMALEFYKKKVADLETELQNTKTFLNMVIHDLRNPINNINYGLDSGLDAIKLAEKLLDSYEQDLLNDLFVWKMPMINEINDFEDEMIDEFRLDNQEEAKVSAEPQSNVKNVPIYDPKSANFGNSGEKNNESNPSSNLRNAREKANQGQNQSENLGSGNISMRQGYEIPPNSERQNSHMREEEKQSVEIINSHQKEIQEMIGKMSVEIDDQKSQFLAKIHNIESKSNGKLESSMSQQNQSVKSNKQPLGQEEEEKVAKPNRKKILDRKQSSSSVNSYNSQESEKQANKNRDQIKSQFFVNKDGEDELEDDESESRQNLIFNRDSKKSGNKNSNSQSRLMSNSLVIPEGDEESQESEELKLQGHLIYKKQPSHKNSYGEIHSESQLVFDHNPSSYNDEQIDKSRDVAQELNETQKINCPKFRLKRGESSSKVADSENYLLDSPLRILDDKSNISDSVDQLFENDLDIPLSSQVDGMQFQAKKNMPDDSVPISKKSQAIQNPTSIKERMKQRKRELNKIRKSLNLAQERMEGCEYSSNLIANLINDLLDFAKMEKFCFTIVKEWFNLGDTIKNAFNVLRFEAQRKGIVLELNAWNNDLSVFNQIYSDESRYLQILLNLLSNALKFTPSGGQIKVKLISCENIQMSESFAIDLDLDQGEIAKNSSDNISRFINKMSICSIKKSVNVGSKKSNYLSIDPLQEYNQKFLNRYNYIKFKMQVIDTGVGISEEGLKNMFMDFGSLGEHAKMNSRGTGLGLSICKNLIEKMGGSIVVSSVKDKGTTFTVEMIEVQRVGEDKRELFNPKEEAKVDQLIVKGKNIKAQKLKMELIQERNSRSEEGDSNPSNNLVSNDMIKLSQNKESLVSHDLLLAKREVQQEELNNRSVNNRQIGSKKNKLLGDSCQYINNLGIVDSMNSNDLDLDDQQYPVPRTKKKNPHSRILLEEQRIKSHTKKEDRTYRSQSSNQSIGQLPVQKQHLKKYIGDQINQGGKYIPAMQSNHGSIEDISLSCSQDIEIGGDAIKGNKGRLMKSSQKELAPFPQQFQDLSILIANDEYFQILAIEQILNKFDIYDITKAENGLIAYEKTLQNKFDFIIMDINMPIMDGIEAGKKIMEHYCKKGIMLNDYDRQSNGGMSGSSNRVPLIFGLSSYVNDKLIHDTKAIGFSDCIQAPFSTSKAEEMLNLYFEEQMRVEIGDFNPVPIDQRQQPRPPLPKASERVIDNKKRVQQPQFKTEDEDLVSNKDNSVSEDDLEDMMQQSEEYNASFSQSSYISGNSGEIRSKEKSKILQGRVIPQSPSAIKNQRENKLSRKQQRYLNSQNGVIKEENSDEDDGE